MKRLVVIGIIIALVVVGGVLYGAHVRAASAAQATQYVLSVVTEGPVRKTVSATGTLQPWSTVDVKSKAGGTVNVLAVDVGSVVSKGQILARIDPTDTLLAVNTAQAGIDGARAHTAQSQAQYGLQVQQSRIAIANAQAALQAAQASRASAAAQAASAGGQARAQPAQTQAAIGQAVANYNAAVQDRQALNSTNPQDRATAQAAYDQARANQKNAQVGLSRQTSLVQKGYVAQQDVDTAQATFDVDAAQVQSAAEKLRTLSAQQQAAVSAADAKVAQARAAVASARAGTVDIGTRRAAARQALAALAQANAQVQQAQATLDQARANVANNSIQSDNIVYNAALVKSNQASLTNATTTLSQTVVRAPRDGIVLTRSVTQGTIITSAISSVAAGTTIVTIGDISRMYVQATVDETDLASISQGQTVEADFEAYPGIPFDGKVILIEPQAVINQNVTQYNVRVEIDNSTPTFRLLKPGMNATCQFIVDSKDSVVNVPSDAIQTDDQGSTYVQVASGGHPAPQDPTSSAPAGALIDVHLTRRAVKAGLEGDDATEITDGLKAGDKIVTQTIEPAPPTPAGGASSPFGGGNNRPGGGGGGGAGGGGRGR